MSEIKIRVEIVNVEEAKELLHQVKTQAEQLEETLKRLNELEIGINLPKLIDSPNDAFEALPEGESEEASIMKTVPTCALSEELIEREGVTAIRVAPYEAIKITTGEKCLELTGPSVILVNID